MTLHLDHRKVWGSTKEKKFRGLIVENNLLAANFTYMLLHPKTHRFEASVSSVYGRRLHVTLGDKWRCAARPPLLTGRICSSQKG